MFRLGSRKSPLALAQSFWVLERLKPYLEAVIIPIECEGDQRLAQPLYALDAEAPGVFTRALEDALLNEKIDFAVHSLKDLPTTQPAGLEIACIPIRESSAEVLVVNESSLGSGLLPVKPGSKIGSSSLRREAQLYSLSKDIFVFPIRGNVATRIEKVVMGEYSATVLARAGLNRLGYKPKGVVLFELPFISAPGQGALAVEVRADASSQLKKGLMALDDERTRRCVSIERRILTELHGGCSLPLGVSVEMDDKVFKLKGFLGLPSKKLQDPGPGRWKGFHPFDISSNDEHTLVAETVFYFKRL